jgi:sugar (pentulose or hexulose) kinase
MADPLLLGFDVGTSSVKAGAFEPTGRMLATATWPIPLSTPNAEICEVDPIAYWDALRGCCGELWNAGVEPTRVVALAVAAHAETLLVLDANFFPLRPAIVWVDRRSTREAADLAARFGEEQLAEMSGQPQMIPMWPATKILWLRRNEPEVFAAARWWLQPLDYLTARLTGEVASHASEYSSSLHLDIRTRDWWEPMLAELEIAAEALPRLVTAGAPVGTLTAAAAHELGLDATVQVVMGGFDQACTAVGAGNVRPGVVAESTGTSLAVTSTVAQPPSPPVRVPCHVHVVPERYFLCAHNPAAGSILQWFRDTLAPTEDFEQLDTLAATAPPGSAGLVLLPYLSGTATPTFDAAARGVFFGLTLEHGRAHLARAILEGVAFALADLLDESRRLGVHPLELRSVGGGARSRFWSQIKADVTGLEVRQIAAGEHAGALGAAVLAGTGAGIFASVEDGADAMVKLASSLVPDLGHRAVYSEARGVYRELYPRIHELFQTANEAAR